MELNKLVVYQDGFNNRVNAILVSKTYNPAWSPASIHDSDFEEIKKNFESNIEPLNLK